MGRQTTAKADERRRRKNAKTSLKSVPSVSAAQSGNVGATSEGTKSTASKTAGSNPTTAKTSTKAAGTKSASSTTSSSSKSAGTKTATRGPATVTKPTPVKKSSSAGRTSGQRAGSKAGQAAKTSDAGGQTKKRTRMSFPVLKRAWKTVRDDVGALLSHPLASYYIILTSVLALTGLGLVMVLSASSITSYKGGEGSSFAFFNKQALYAGIGLALMIVASMLPLSVWKKLAWPAMGVGLVLQAAVFLPGLGKATKGNANWIGFGGFQLQPSEFLKVALALWLGFVLAQKFGKMNTFGHAMIPVVPGVLAAAGLIVAGNDLGTALVIMAMAAVCLFIGGFPMKYFALLASVLAAAVVFFVLSSENRLKRIESMLTGHADQTDADTMGQAWQSNHGLFSLASGGWGGVGLGASREKWSWLPEAHNDFIFAIIGEELGLVGGLAVILVFALLGYGMVRIVLRSKNIMIQVAAAGYFALIIGQAAINIGVVAGLLPVIGLPLPFVSYGGSSIISSLLAVGVLLSFAKTEPGAEAAIAVQKDRMRSSFGVLARKRRK
jgi:cell division protein FtsW